MRPEKFETLAVSLLLLAGANVRAAISKNQANL